MGSLSGLEIGFSLVFGVIFVGFVAEMLFYVLYWKTRLSGEIHDDESISNQKYTPLLSYFFCWKKKKNTNPDTNRSQQELNSTVSRNREKSELEQDLELGNSTDSLLKGLGGEESVDLELMRVHNLWGPPRFLFTINEETKEDLESAEDAKSRGSRKGSRTRSLSDIVFTAATTATADTTPLASPSIKSSLLVDGHRGIINPLFESFSDSDLNHFLRSSPPPKFKFLRDVEEKLIRKLVEESERRKVIIKDHDSGFKSTDNSQDKLASLEQQEITIHSSGPSKVLPLASSPSN